MKKCHDRVDERLSLSLPRSSMRMISRDEGFPLIRGDISSSNDLQIRLDGQTVLFDAATMLEIRGEGGIPFFLSTLVFMSSFKQACRCRS